VVKESQIESFTVNLYDAVFLIEMHF
jgi:hypothetical protein